VSAARASGWVATAWRGRLVCEIAGPRADTPGRPAPGVSSSRLQVLADPEQGPAVVLQYFDTADDMVTGARVFAAMDPTETPGTRASVDACEVKLDITAS
jgi:hypothetical protein